MCVSWVSCVLLSCVVCVVCRVCRVSCVVCRVYCVSGVSCVVCCRCCATTPFLTNWIYRSRTYELVLALLVCLLTRMDPIHDATEIWFYAILKYICTTESVPTKQVTWVFNYAKQWLALKKHWCSAYRHVNSLGLFTTNNGSEGLNNSLKNYLLANIDVMSVRDLAIQLAKKVMAKHNTRRLLAGVCHCVSCVSCVSCVVCYGGFGFVPVYEVCCEIGIAWSRCV